MKNIGSGLLVALISMLVFACQPKDEKLQRQTNTVNNNGAPGAVTDMNAQELNQLLALNFDRMAEAVHLLKATLNPDYAALYNIAVTDPKGQKSVITKALSNRVDLSNLNVLSTKNETNTKDKAPTVKNANLNLTVRRLLTDEDGTVLQFVAVKEVSDEIRNAGYIYDAKKAPVDFSAVTQTEFVSVQQIEAGRYSVKVARGEDVSSKKDSNSLMITRLSFELSWSGKIMDLDEVLKVKLLALDITRKGNKRGFLCLKADAAVNEVGLKLSDCVSLNGDVKVAIKQPKKDNKEQPDLIKTVRISDSTVKIDEDKAFLSPAISCSGRPVVDLTRML